MKKAVKILLLIPLMLLPHAHAAEINGIGEYCSGPCAYLKGEIKSGDLIKLKVVFESPTRRRIFIPDFKPPTEIFELQLNSRGGSLEEAMEIGRWVRKTKFTHACRATQNALVLVFISSQPALAEYRLRLGSKWSAFIGHISLRCQEKAFKLR